MGDISKITLALFLVAFWLFLPIGLIWMEVGGETLDVTLNNAETGNFLDFMGIYFNMLIFNIPNVPIILRIFVNFLQLASAFLITLILRGN